MKTLKKWINELLPDHGLIALLAAVCVNTLVYNGSRFISEQLYHYRFATDIDAQIPFIKEFVIVYIPIAYGQWIYGFYLSARKDVKTCRMIFTAEITAKLMYLLFFLVIPTTMERAHIAGTDIFSKWVHLVYSTDAADNLFPSIHCIESYLLMRTCGMLLYSYTFSRYRLIQHLYN
ncbi:MAG: hypothetical protein II722_10610 [Ruminococcus sp.]|nr:hypothetical protein [Ruminococcus sp.]